MLIGIRNSLSRYGSLEPAILASLVTIAFLLWGFSEIAMEMLEGSTYKIDISLLMLLRDVNDPASLAGPTWLQDIMRDMSALGGIAVLSLVTFFAFVYLLMIKKAGRAIYLVTTVISGTIVSDSLKAYFDRPRPEFIPHDITILTASFPSGHSMMSTVVYLSLGALIARMQTDGRVKIYFMTIAIILPLIIGFSRVYLGVHWPSDVLAGWTLGACWALLFWTIETIYLRNIRRGIL